MKKALIALIVVCLIVTCAVPVPAFCAATQPFTVDARAALLMDYDSGTVMYEKSADQRVPIASVTKVMTLNLIFDEIESKRLKLTDMVTISEEAGKIGGSSALCDANYAYRVDELIKAIIVASANDCCLALAERICGTEEVFVQRMNAKAQAMGMKNTHFTNCTGMPTTNHYSSARDVMIMSKALVGHKDFFRWSSVWMYDMQHKDGRTTSLTNTNRLIRFYDGCDGLKTGSTSDALYCLSATAKKNGMRLIAVVLGAPTSDKRFAEAKKLLNYGFSNFEKVQLVKKGEVLQQAFPVKGGKEKTVRAIAGAEFSMLLPRGENQNVERKLDLPKEVTAPVKKGQKLGDLLLTRNGNIIAKIPVQAESEVRSSSFFEYLRLIAGYWTGHMK